jgi:hypothetical protein
LAAIYGIIFRSDLTAVSVASGFCSSCHDRSHRHLETKPNGRIIVMWAAADRSSGGDCASISMARSTCLLDASHNADRRSSGNAVDSRKGKRSPRRIGMLFLVAVFVAPVIALAEAAPPYELEHHREILNYLQQHRQPGDVIYVVQLQEIGTQFYGPRYGLQPNEWITGICDANDARAYLRDVDRFRGAPRLWVLTGSGRPLKAVHAAVRSYLGTIGVCRDVKTFPSMTLGIVSIELYDLSDPVRLVTASAEKFPVPAMPRDPRIGCREWTKPKFDWHLGRP